MSWTCRPEVVFLTAASCPKRDFYTHTCAGVRGCVQAGKGGRRRAGFSGQARLCLRGGRAGMGILSIIPV
jgi:hypothetical protein